MAQKKLSSDYIFYSAGYKYQLRRTYKCRVKIFPDKFIVTEFITLSPVGILTIRRGYAWDGPSGPTIDTPSFMRGSLVHDALYQLMREGLLDQKWRKQADIELYNDCLEDDMWTIRANYVYGAVRKMAGPAADPKNSKLIIKAPKKKRGH